MKTAQQRKRCVSFAALKAKHRSILDGKASENDVDMSFSLAFLMSGLWLQRCVFGEDYHHVYITV